MKNLNDYLRRGNNICVSAGFSTKNRLKVKFTKKEYRKQKGPLPDIVLFWGDHLDSVS